MKIRLRIFLGFVFLIMVALISLLSWILKDIRYEPLKTMEESMVDTANILASYLETQVDKGEVRPDELRRVMRRATGRQFRARIYTLSKGRVDMRVYVTDDKGKVLFDSAGTAEGKDFSRWNDVYLTLHGGYGVRATRGNPEDFYSSVLYVAAPVRADGRTVGVVSVSKSVEGVKLFWALSSRRIFAAGLVGFLAAALVSLVIAAWITRPIQRLTDYADAVRTGRRERFPALGGSEIGTLGRAFEEMREALEGKKYVESYVQTLTHELRTPITSIRGAAEILQEDPPAERRRTFVDNIHRESVRMQQLVDRLLQLAQLENRRQLVQIEDVQLADVAGDVLQSVCPAMENRDVVLTNRVDKEATVPGEVLLIRLALLNLVQNAVEFSPPGGAVVISTEQDESTVTLVVSDNGPGIPDFAMERVCEKFFSLPRPGTSRKSTGLGLSTVKEIAELHGGTVSLENRPGGGAIARLRLPKRAVG